MHVADQIRELFDRPDAEVDLGRAAATLARLEYPDADIEACMRRIDAYAGKVGARLDKGRPRETAVSAINKLLFEELGFRGNREDYYDPRNSFLNDVLERRTGIPISLSVLYLEIAKRLELPIYGVGLPSHFVVKYDDRSRLFFVDPYHEGRVLNQQGCRELVKTLHGRPVDLHDLHFAAVENRSIVLRMLNNLRAIYLSARRHRLALEVLDTILALEPDSAEEIKQRAWVRYELGERGSALRDLERYVDLRPNGADAEQVQDWMNKLRRTLAHLN
ncbi:MAG: tetratricopeptide repeat protein [Acidobacteria bacterium]|nr:tetratricopeptide repeat protein [Acidobacteriota bacterium]